MTYLAAVLFLPWFLIRGTLFWLFPREPRTAPPTAGVRRRGAAGRRARARMVFALGAWPRGSDLGGMWPQVLAASVGYGVFLAVLLAGGPLAAPVWSGGRSGPQ
jgi:hypothetical protein